MTEVTDKIVEAARAAAAASGGQDWRLRAAIEDALAASAESPVNAGELVHRLRHNISYTVLSLIKERDQAADAIEELVEALQRARNILDYDGSAEAQAAVHAADVILTRMGVKLDD